MINNSNNTKEFRTQLLKWIGNKQRFASEIISYFPKKYNYFYEPFFGSGSISATLAPKLGIGSDTSYPLIEIWKCLKSNPNLLKTWYQERWELARISGKEYAYNKIRDSYNKKPNGADLLFLCRSCYGGVIRFRKKDGYMSTPCGVHEPITPQSFSHRVDEWSKRLKNVNFLCCDYKEIFTYAKSGDLIYCDPPYVHSQSILYKGQNFNFEELITEISKAKSKGIFVALSIDGFKKSGKLACSLPIPKDLFTQEKYVNVGRSMLKRFQMGGKTLENEMVNDRLLLTYD